MVPSLELLANMSYQAKVVEIMAAHVHDVSIITLSLSPSPSLKIYSKIPLILSTILDFTFKF